MDTIWRHVVIDWSVFSEDVDCEVSVSLCVVIRLKSFVVFFVHPVLVFVIWALWVRWSISFQELVVLIWVIKSRRRIANWSSVKRSYAVDVRLSLFNLSMFNFTYYTSEVSSISFLTFCQLTQFLRAVSFVRVSIPVLADSARFISYASMQNVFFLMCHTSLDIWIIAQVSTKYTSFVIIIEIRERKRLLIGFMH